MRRASSSLLPPMRIAVSAKLAVSFSGACGTGFLAPTPTMPKLPFVEVEDAIFAEVGAWLTPKTVEQTRWRFFGMSMLCIGAPGDSRVGSAPGGVRLLHEQKVGGYEVNVLEAD